MSSWKWVARRINKLCSDYLLSKHSLIRWELVRQRFIDYIGTNYDTINKSSHSVVFRNKITLLFSWVLEKVPYPFINQNMGLSFILQKINKSFAVFNFPQIWTVIGGRPDCGSRRGYHCLPMQNLDEYILYSSSRVFYYSFTPVGRARNRRGVCEGDLCWAPQIYVVRFNRHVMDIWMTF